MPLDGPFSMPTGVIQNQNVTAALRRDKPFSLIQESLERLLIGM